MPLLVRIPFLDLVQLRIAGLVAALWFLFGLLLRNIFSRKPETVTARNPPDCLTDSSLGQHAFVKIRGVKLHYVEAGFKSSPLLLLLHGFPDCWITWRHQIPELSKHFRVVAVDLKGFGDSDKPWGRSGYEPEAIASELGDLVQGLGGRASVVGHGLGALLGWLLVHTRPHLVHRFVSISVPHPNLYWDHLPSSGQLVSSRWVSLCQVPWLGESKAMEKDLAFIDAAHHYLSPSRPFDSQLIDGYKYLFSRTEDWTGALNYLRRLPLWRVEGKQLETTVPVLLVVGAEDGDARLDDFIRTTEHLITHSLKVVDAAGSHPHIQRPQHTNTILLQFLVDHKEAEEEKGGQQGLVGRMLGAVSSTVRMGKVLGAFNKKAELTALNQAMG